MNATKIPFVILSIWW